MRNIKLLSKLLRYSQLDLQMFLNSFLVEHYGFNNVVFSQDYIYALGNDEAPILLAAHMDTVYDFNYSGVSNEKRKSEEKELIYDAEKDILWSPQGLGADDRAGVFMILLSILDGHRPHVLFTRDEEVGGFGAREFTSSQLCYDMKHRVKYIVQLDRKGSNDCVFYDCENLDFEKYIESFGFKTAFGTFTDISIIAPVAQVAATNLSVGYYREHTKMEHLCLLQMFKNYDIIIKMIKDSKELKTFFKYEARKPIIRAKGKYIFSQCDICLGNTNELTRINQIGYVCNDCLTYFE